MRNLRNTVFTNLQYRSPLVSSDTFYLIYAPSRCHPPRATPNHVNTLHAVTSANSTEPGCRTERGKRAQVSYLSSCGKDIITHRLMRNICCSAARVVHVSRCRVVCSSRLVITLSCHAALRHPAALVRLLPGS